MTKKDSVKKLTNGLKNAYGFKDPKTAKKFFDSWAGGYEEEALANGYVTPERCAKALAEFVDDKSGPVADLACGTGLSGIALRAQGFATIDGFDFSPEMLEKARAKEGLYRDLQVCDMSKPFTIPEEAYANVAAIGCITPDYVPVTVLDEILKIIPSGGHFTFSINDMAMEDGAMERHISEICDCRTAELVFSEHGRHIPGINLGCTVFVLRKI